MVDIVIAFPGEVYTKASAALLSEVAAELAIKDPEGDEDEAEADEGEG